MSVSVCLCLSVGGSVGLSSVCLSVCPREYPSNHICHSKLHQIFRACCLYRSSVLHGLLLLTPLLHDIGCVMSYRLNESVQRLLLMGTESLMHHSPVSVLLSQPWKIIGARGYMSSATVESGDTDLRLDRLPSTFISFTSLCCLRLYTVTVLLVW